MSRYFFIFLFLLASLAGFSQKVATQLLDDSWIAINGRSNIVDFSFHQAADNFIKKTMSFTANRVDTRVRFSENRLSIEVKKFDSSNKMALRDFFKLVDAEKYPHIQIALDYVETARGDTLVQKGDVYADTHVDITIVGVENKYSFPVKVFNKANRLTLTGKKRIDIGDFGLEPPNELFGLVRVSEWIEIEFQINLLVDVDFSD
jgi:polyisoprenoid-binding protein YceI